MEEKELLKRVASVLSPFPIKERGDGIDIWCEQEQTFITVRDLKKLSEYVAKWVIDTCREGEWKQGYYYEVPKKAADFAVFFGNVTSDYYKFYIKTFVEVKEFSEYLKKTIDVFVPSQKISAFYPLTILMKKTCIQLDNVEIDEQTINILQYNKHLLERLFSAYREFDVKQFDNVAYEILSEAKKIDDKLWYVLSIISAKMYTFMKQYENLPFY